MPNMQTRRRDVVDKGERMSDTMQSTLPNGTAVRYRDEIVHVAGVLVSPRAASKLYWFLEKPGCVGPHELEIVTGHPEVIR